ncbi:unnamed protein product [Cuscuta epithymum]|uniref:Uncharacterized protein n=1 Tax=Cuscuta epithymum TaxID=186058 RepID=A0AAV0DZ61_9ASTE|nr:unnamed protein product [Cuscuta epithymum]CAH9146338.1 unnamed protein product [Cuscuta epithymum]
MEMKHLSSIAADVLRQCAQTLGKSVEDIVIEFEVGWEASEKGYSKKLLEFACSKALAKMFSLSTHDAILDSSSFSRFTFDMMLAWNMPSSADEESYNECAGKEKEDKQVAIINTNDQGQDDIPLFYSDIMPLLVDHEPSVTEDAFVWLSTLVPVIADVVTARFTFETLTAPSGCKLHYPAYNLFLKQIDKCTRHLQKQAKPTGVELEDNEFILHVEGTATTQRVVRHIGGTSWPGRLTLTNYALYFEASGVLSYEDALRIDLSKDIEQSIVPASTGPWGAPLFDKAIVYKSSELQEGVVLEFPEMTSSTRRDHWLALVKEIMLFHKFLLNYEVRTSVESWEMHARTMLGIIRLHAVREMLRICPPVPKSFLIFTLLDELPKGDYVLEELARSLKKANIDHPCSASSIFKCINVSQLSTSLPERAVKEVNVKGNNPLAQSEDVSSLESAIDQAREEEKEIIVAKATVEEVREEGIANNVQAFLCLVKPLGAMMSRFQDIFTWERPLTTFIVLVITLLVIYKEWVGKAIAAFLLCVVTTMLRARQLGLANKHNKILIYIGTDKSAVENIVSAQQGLKTAGDIIQQMNVILLKVWSLFASKAPKQSNTVVAVMIGVAVVLALVPFKYILMGLVLSGFISSSKMMGKGKPKDGGNRRLKEWWDSIPVAPVEVIDEKAADDSVVVL